MWIGGEAPPLCSEGRAGWCQARRLESWTPLKRRRVASADLIRIYCDS